MQQCGNQNETGFFSHYKKKTYFLLHYIVLLLFEKSS